MVDDAALQTRFWRLFGRAMGRELLPGRYAKSDIEAWDSLRHVELMFEIEEQFGVSIPPAKIAELYTDTDTLLAYLATQVRAQP